MPHVLLRAIGQGVHTVRIDRLTTGEFGICVNCHIDVRHKTLDKALDLAWEAYTGQELARVEMEKQKLRAEIAALQARLDKLP
jgi:hypothetical protein